MRGNATLNTLTAWVDAVKMVLRLMVSLIFVSLLKFSFLFPLEYLFGLCNKFTTPYTGYR
jgi:hypothetical protein